MSQFLYITEIFKTIATEMFKVQNNLCQEITSNIFIEGANCLQNLRSTKDSKTPVVKSVDHGTESIGYFKPKIWDIAPDKIKKKSHL